MEWFIYDMQGFDGHAYAMVWANSEYMAERVIYGITEEETLNPIYHSNPWDNVELMEFFSSILDDKGSVIILKGDKVTCKTCKELGEMALSYHRTYQTIGD